MAKEPAWKAGKALTGPGGSSPSPSAYEEYQQWKEQARKWWAPDDKEVQDGTDEGELGASTT